MLLNVTLWCLRLTTSWLLIKLQHNQSHTHTAGCGYPGCSFVCVCVCDSVRVIHKSLPGSQLPTVSPSFLSAEAGLDFRKWVICAWISHCAQSRCSSLPSGCLHLCNLDQNSWLSLAFQIKSWQKLVWIFYFFCKCNLPDRFFFSSCGALKGSCS